VAKVADATKDVQILAVAGKNASLKRSLDKVAADRPGKIVPLGFVDNMHELMAASDFAVTKPGGLTSSECLALGLPMVIVQPIPGQEERNSDFLLENGVALRANSAAHLAYKVGRMIEDDKLRRRMQTAAKRLAKPRAAMAVARSVLR
jgi:processive 1,2-diacylglycerol beta-glucosyltransferase